MVNKEIARIFYHISEILRFKNVQWKPQAYNKAARVIEDMEEDLKEVYKEKGLRGLDEVPGVGQRMAKKIEEYIKTGKIKEYEKLKKSTPKGLTELMEIGGIGPKRAKQLYQKLKIKSVGELQKAVRKHKIKVLERFGEKSEKDIEESIEVFKKRRKGRLLLGQVLPIAENIIEELKKEKGVKRVVACGSLRRMYETIGDVDLLATGDKPKNIIEKFCGLKEVKKVLAKGSTRGMVLLDNNLQADIRVVRDEVFGSALQYFTGSKDHSIEVRKIAIKKGMKLSEYGLFKGKKRIARTEEEIYKKLGMQFIPAELRENKGEVEVALKKKIPRLVGYGDVKGDLQVHTDYSDGTSTILEMAKGAKSLGYKYLGISDHSKTRKIAGGLSEKDLMRQMREIDKVKIKIKGLKILKSVEADILGDGSLDYSDKMLKKLDYVVGAIHSGFKGDVTKRILRAMENKYMNILAHPTGRLINRRGECKLDFKKILEKAKEKNVILEINAHPERLDLRDEYIKVAVENGNKLIINTDAHSVKGLKDMKLGVGQARRGWARKKDVVNTLGWNELKKVLRK